MPIAAALEESPTGSGIAPLGGVGYIKTGEHAMIDDPLIGFLTDTLRFDALLGKGAMGAVYKGVQISLGRTVAIKVIAPHLANDDAYITRFSREAQTLGRLVHPHVIACHDVGPCNGPNGAPLFVMVLEFVDGWSLGHLLKAKKLTVRQVLELHRQAAEGLASAHQLGIVHRDVKPDNIMVTRQGQAKLADFGLAKADDSAMLTQTGAILGSPSYMAPEACRGEQPTALSDLYSLGCSLFHALSGTTPYAATSALQAIQQHVNAPVPALSSRRSDLAALDGLLIRALAKKAEERYANAAAMAKAIRAALPLIPAEVIAGGGQLPVSPSLAVSPTMVSGQQTQATKMVIPSAPAGASPVPPAAASPAARPSLLKWGMIGGAVAVVATLLIVLAAPGPRQTTAPPPSVKPPIITNDSASDETAKAIAIKLDTIEDLLRGGQVDGAENLLGKMTIPDEPRYAAYQGRLAELVGKASAARASTPASHPGDGQQSLKEAMTASLAAIKLDIDANHLGKAEVALKALVVNDELKPRKNELQKQLDAAWKTEGDRLTAELDEAERELNANHLGEARRALKNDFIPEHFPEQIQRRNELQRRVFAAMQSTFTDAAKSATVNVASGSTSVLRYANHDEFPGWLAQNGWPAVPSKQPSGDVRIFGSLDAGGRTSLKLRLPTPQHPGHDHLLVMLRDGLAVGRELRVDRLIGDKVLPGVTAKLTGRDWDILNLPVTDAEQPVDALMLSAPSFEGEKIWLAKALFGSSTTPSAADLQVTPGTLLSMVYKATNPLKRNEGLYYDLVTACRARPAFLDPRQFRLAVPVGALDDRNKAASLRMLHHIADALARAGDAEKPATVLVDEQNQLIAYPNSATLKGTFDQAVAANAHLLFLMLATDGAPRALPGELARLCGEAIDKGTVPVVLLTSNSALGQERDAWERFIALLHKERPGLAIIDLAEVPLFIKQNHLPLPAATSDAYLEAVLGGLDAGLRELLERIEWALRSGGVRSAAGERASGDEPKDPPAPSSPRRPFPGRLR